MAEYTMTIADILRTNAGSDDLTTIDGMYAAATRALFSQEYLNYINSQHRVPFVVGFALHFFKDEIGLETLLLFKFALSEKLINHSPYINQLMDRLQTQLYADYRVEESHGAGSSSRTLQGTGTTATTEETAGETARTATGSATRGTTYGKTETTEHTGTDAIAHTGTDTTAHTGTDTTAHTGTDTTTHTGTDTTVKAEEGTVEDAGTLTIAHTGDNSTEQEGTTTTEHLGTTRTTTSSTRESDTETSSETRGDANAINISFDTPMGNLGNMRTPGGDPAGKGVTYAVDNTYQYMTAATEGDSTTTSDASGTDHAEEEQTSTSDQELIGVKDKTGFDDYITTETFNSTDTHTNDLTKTITNDVTDTRTLNTSDARTLNTSDARALNTSDARTLNTSDARTINTADETTQGGQDETTEATEQTGSETTEGTREVTGTTTESQTEAGQTADDRTATQYTITMDALLKAQSLMERVWELFDDLFMLMW